MKRVSSRQRLVSWDAFEANADSESTSGNDCSVIGCEEDEVSFASGYESAFSQSFHSSTGMDRLYDGSLDEHNICHKTEGGVTKVIFRRRKRDRRSRRSPKNCKNSLKIEESPKPCTSVTPLTSDTPTIIPAFSWERGESTSLKLPSLSPSTKFNSLMDDIHINIFSFLDLPSLRAAMSVNRRYRKIIASGDAISSIWMNHCRKLWNVDWKEDSPDQYHQQILPNFVDNFRLPIAAESDIGATNLSLLLSMTPSNFPTCVDENALKSRLRLGATIRQTIPVNRLEEEEKLVQYYKEKLTGRSLVRYTGYVGQGDRCIKSDRPLPRPFQPSKGTSSGDSEDCSSTLSDLGASFLGATMTHRHIDPHRPFFLSFLQRSGSKSRMGHGEKVRQPSVSLPNAQTSASPERTPFVVPFVEKSEIASSVNVTPRFIAYFEVSILKPDENSVEDVEMRFRPRSPSHRTSHSDCVAVGLAMKEFQVQSRMPGWDRVSFGYHGDDGGIFHASGGMQKEFGPKFGAGDTVGCGVDYISKSIFYTLNGKFLGYAWENVSDSILENDLYPAVGLDTNCPIHLNWGSSGPFQFDLSGFIQKHEELVMQVYSKDHNCISCPTNDVAISPSKTETKATTHKSTRSRRQRRGMVGRRNHCDRR